MWFIRLILLLSLIFKLEHEASGASWVHLERADTNNAFLIAFRTLPSDASGVAHVLEHCVLCGSKTYPGTGSLRTHSLILAVFTPCVLLDYCSAGSFLPYDEAQFEHLHERRNSCGQHYVPLFDSKRHGC